MNPAFSPGGDKIAFDGSFSGGNNEIYVTTLNTKEQINLTYNPSVDSNPTWSPDGKQIGFESNRDGYTDIYVMSADGTNQTNLTNSPGVHDGAPVFSPDGKKIAFSSNREIPAGIYLMGADSVNPIRLTEQVRFNAPNPPRFSPDGTKVLVWNSVAVAVVNVEGTASTELVDHNGGVCNRLLSFRLMGRGSLLLAPGTGTKRSTRLT